MSSFRLSQRASADLDDIFYYTLVEFGRRQARRYADGLVHCFDALAASPRMGRKADAIRPGVRRHLHASHIVLYEIDGDGITVLAVVHGRRATALRL